MEMTEAPFIHETAIIDAGAQIGVGTKIWHHSHVRATAIIGKNVTIGKNVYIDDGVVIGNNVKIQNNVSVYRGVFIEDDVFVGPSVVFTNDLRPRAFLPWDSTSAPATHICKGASLGANASILCGVTIGEYAMVGMGSVVVKPVGSFELWIGNPAVCRGIVDKDGNSA
jgi:UDP-2-acetamido-3-amino-2,3-dideoxy-glucuronate N-acetyltransferase